MRKDRSIPPAVRRVAPVALVLLVSCGGPDAHLEPRYVAVHNTLSALGLAQTGAISQGSLDQEGDVRVVVPLAAGQCTVFVALGSGGVDDLDLRVVDENGDTLVRDGTTDRQAAVQFCPPRAGEYAVSLRVAAGRGDYTLGTWSGAGVASAGGVGGRGGGCATPAPLALGTPVQGSTEGGSAAHAGSCAQGNAPENVFVVEVEERAQLTAVLDSEFDGVLYLRRECGDGAAEVSCNDDSPDGNTRRSELRATVDPGSYFLFVDGYGEEAGAFQLLATLSPLESVEAVCDAARPIAPGQAVNGDTRTSADYFQATCADRAGSPDVVHRLDVRERSRLRILQRSDHDGALHVRRECTELTSEIACNDDFTDQRSSLVRAIVDPGSYYVFSDGFGESSAGPFTFTAELEDVAGAGVPGDDCASPTAVSAVGSRSAPTTLEVDTFRARDDLAGSCGGAGAPDVVHAFSVRRRGVFRAWLDAPQALHALYVRGASCADAAREVVCKTVQPPEPGQQGPSRLDTVLAPGRYHLVVDGSGETDFGAAQLHLALEDAGPFERACRRAPMLRPGRTVEDSTAGASSMFEATCAAGAASPEDVYRLRLRQESTVVIAVESEYDAALHLRSDCLDPATEVACNDDHEDNRHARIEEVLAPGTWYVFVDGFREESAGDYELDVTVTPR